MIKPSQDSPRWQGESSLIDTYNKVWHKLGTQVQEVAAHIISLGCAPVDAWVDGSVVSLVLWVPKSKVAPVKDYAHSLDSTSFESSSSNFKLTLDGFSLEADHDEGDWSLKLTKDSKMKTLVAIAAAFEDIKNTTGKTVELRTYNSEGKAFAEPMKLGRGKSLRVKTDEDNGFKVWVVGTKVYRYMKKTAVAQLKKQMMAPKPPKEVKATPKAKAKVGLISSEVDHRNKSSSWVRLKTADKIDKRFVDAFVEKLNGIQKELLKYETDDSSTPAAPNSSAFRAAKSGKMEVLLNAPCVIDGKRRTAYAQLRIGGATIKGLRYGGKEGADAAFAVKAKVIEQFLKLAGSDVDPKGLLSVRLESADLACSIVFLTGTNYYSICLLIDKP